jgi:flavodoxin I
MIQGAPPKKSFRNVLMLVSLLIGGMGVVVLYSQISGGGQSLAVLEPASNLAMAARTMQPLRAQINRAEAKAVGCRALGAKGLGYAMGFAARSGAWAGCRGQLTCVRAVGLFFGTQTGKTEDVADLIAAKAGIEKTDIADAGGAADLEGFDGIIAGVPTWHTGADEQRSGTTWDDYLEEISALSLSGKPVAIFGLGDQASYGDNFCDGIEELHNTFEKAGAKMLGYVDASGYDMYTESKSVKDGKFLGLPLDGDNEPDMSEDRVNKWVDQIKSEGMPLM